MIEIHSVIEEEPDLLISRTNEKNFLAIMYSLMTRNDFVCCKILRNGVFTYYGCIFIEISEKNWEDILRAERIRTLLL